MSHQRAPERPLPFMARAWANTSWHEAVCRCVRSARRRARLLRADTGRLTSLRRSEMPDPCSLILAVSGRSAILFLPMPLRRCGRTRKTDPVAFPPPSGRASRSRIPLTRAFAALSRCLRLSEDKPG